MNVKQGDLAISTKAFLPENVGRIVTVIQYQGEEGGYSNVWLCRQSRPAPGVTAWGDVIDGEYGFIPDAWLRPISGIPDFRNTNESIGHDAGIKEFA